ncbi:MAG: hypothetical protein P1V97_38425 [Planctomycetota bacterium]|nr:hypothetical protein [Planctomycetota bacterium]
MVISFLLESNWPEKGVTVGVVGLPEYVAHHETLTEEALLFAVRKLLNKAIAILTVA